MLRAIRGYEGCPPFLARFFREQSVLFERHQERLAP
jgi:hypothetical protein